ncbi:4'-phosphopantetheinyl transferase family protein [Janibacter sp. Soil728]|uniref:4'-phosphopantetheinyl transferase family protein n=1 Tax=Janibacter sp. Soil728 TaxID=1736393 RepID=UPI000AE4A1B4|nr:4'-phosphopantetheinyl transferase superfamily protein [Janibacter sp. Soil728]
MWHDARSLGSLRSKRLEGNDALRAHLSSPVTIGRHCPTCGSTTHGRPWVRLPDGTSPHVSLSRCGEHVVTVVADDPVGIDVESIAAVDARWDPALVLHPDEPDPAAPAPTRPGLAGSGRAHSPMAMRENLHSPMAMHENLHSPMAMRENLHSPMAMQRAAAWCRKEAILKALGTGLSTPMSEIRVADWQVVDIEAPGGLAAAVATIPQPGRGGSSTS